MFFLETLGQLGASLCGFSPPLGERFVSPFKPDVRLQRMSAFVYRSIVLFGTGILYVNSALESFLIELFIAFFLANSTLSLCILVRICFSFPISYTISLNISSAAQFFATQSFRHSMDHFQCLHVQILLSDIRSTIFFVYLIWARNATLYHKRMHWVTDFVYLMARGEKN